MISKIKELANFILLEQRDIENKNTHSISRSNIKKTKNKTQRNQILTTQKKSYKKRKKTAS